MTDRNDSTVHESAVDAAETGRRLEATPFRRSHERDRFHDTLSYCGQSGPR